VVDIAIMPNGKTAYVSNGNSNTVTPIAIATNEPGKPIKVGIEPLWIDHTPIQALGLLQGAGLTRFSPVKPKR
jgi:YVTN family beta-propeller protein